DARVLVEVGGVDQRLLQQAAVLEFEAEARLEFLPIGHAPTSRTGQAHRMRTRRKQDDRPRRSRRAAIQGGDRAWARRGTQCPRADSAPSAPFGCGHGGSVPYASAGPMNPLAARPP